MKTRRGNTPEQAPTSQLACRGGGPLLNCGVTRSTLSLPAPTSSSGSSASLAVTVQSRYSWMVAARGTCGANVKLFPLILVIIILLLKRLDSRVEDSYAGGGPHRAGRAAAAPAGEKTGRGAEPGRWEARRRAAAWSRQAGVARARGTCRHRQRGTAKAGPPPAAKKVFPQRAPAGGAHLCLFGAGPRRRRLPGLKGLEEEGYVAARALPPLGRVWCAVVLYLQHHVWPAGGAGCVS